jgi:hypothetical protein
MDTDEHEIFRFLKTWGMSFTNGNEVCRRAGTKQRFHEDPHWAKPILARMEERGILEKDAQGRYRVKPISKRKQRQQWIAPNIAEILKESGVAVDREPGAEGEAVFGDDEYYDNL